MRVLSQIALCVLLAGSASAQRGGGGGMRGGGGMHGGGGIGVGGGGFRGGGVGIGGGFRGGGVGIGGGGFRGGVGYGGFYGNRGFYGNHGFYGGFYGGLYGGYWPYYSSYYPWWGYGYGYGYPDYGYGYGYAPEYYDYAYPSNYSSPVTVVYPQQQQTQPNTVYVDRARPVMREYDQYGQEIRQPASPASSPLYLIAFKDRSIQAAASYSVDGRTLHYVTMQHEEKQASLDSVDREFSLQLNRERGVAFNLPQ